MESAGISVVVPVFQGAATLPTLVRRLDDALSDCGPVEMILVDDGSWDASWAVIQELSGSYPQIVGLRLGRNFGQHNALVAGVRAASMPLTVTIDDDLQNPPEEIPRLVAALIEQQLDVVYGVPTRPEQAVSRRVAGRVTRLALKSGLGVSSALDVSSFRVFRTSLRSAFAGEIGSSVSLDALLTWGADRFGSVRVQHDARSGGSSNYNFRKLLRHAIDTITGYSTLPLQFASGLGLVMAVFGLFVLGYALVRFLVTGGPVPGFTFLVSSIAIFSGAQLLTLGIFGEYLARIHFRTMGRPTYVVADILRTDGESS